MRRYMYSEWMRIRCPWLGTGGVSFCRTCFNELDNLTMYLIYLAEPILHFKSTPCCGLPECRANSKNIAFQVVIRYTVLRFESFLGTLGWTMAIRVSPVPQCLQLFTTASVYRSRLYQSSSLKAWYNVRALVFRSLSRVISDAAPIAGPQGMYLIYTGNNETDRGSRRRPQINTGVHTGMRLCCVDGLSELISKRYRRVFSSKYDYII